MTKAKSSFLVPLIAVVTIPLIYFYPRFLIEQLGESNPWTSYLYLYGFGGYFFAIGILLILKTGACKPGRGRDSKWLTILLSGFVALATIHASWIYLALSIPFKGEVN